MKKENGENVGNSLNDFIHEYGAPYHLTFDGVAVQVGSKTKFVDYLRRNHIHTHILTPRQPNENPAEGSIQEVKKKWYRIKGKKKVPDKIWDFGIHRKVGLNDNDSYHDKNYISLRFLKRYN